MRHGEMPVREAVRPRVSALDSRAATRNAADRPRQALATESFF